MKCTKHEQHDCVYCWRDKLESALAAASTRIFDLERKLSKAEIERGWAIGEHKKALVGLEAMRAQKPCLFAYKIFSSSSGFVYTTDESEAVMGGADSGGYKKLYAQPVLAPTQVSDEPVIDKPTLPPGWQVVRVPDVEFQPRDQIYISKIGVDGKAERGGTACRLDDSSLFWHFFNDWLLMQEGAG